MESDVIKRIRQWHAERASGGSGPNEVAIRENAVDRWYDVDALLSEIDRLRGED